MVSVLCALTLTKSLDLHPFLLFPSIIYKLCNLASLEYAYEPNLGDCLGLDYSHFLRHEPSMVKVHVG
jgi:hypothetical protein